MASPIIAYPNVSFSESIIGPTPTRLPWDDTVGVVGQFSRGPAIPTVVKTRQDFQRFFGEDNSPGSLFVQQCFAQGHSDFVISRAVPSPSPASAVFRFTSPNQNLVPQIGYNVDGETFVPSPTAQTTGLGIELSYISSPQVTRDTYFPVDSAISRVTNPNFQGRGQFVFNVVKFQEGRATQDFLSPTGQSIQLSIRPTGSNDYQIATFSASDSGLAAVEPFLLPGFALLESTPSLQDNPLVIVSKPFALSSTLMGILVKGQFGFCTLGNVNANVTAGATTVEVAALTQFGVAVPSPTPSVLQTMAVVINGVRYAQTAVPTTVSNVHTLTIGAGLPALPTGTKVTLRPTVLPGSINTSTQTLIIQGLFNPGVITIGAKISFGNNDDIYTVSAVTTGSNQATVTLTEPINTRFVTNGIDVRITPTSTATSTVAARVCYAPHGHSIIGYTYQSLDAQTVNSTDPTRQYFTIPGETYNDGYTTYDIDSYIAVQENVGGYYRDFSFQLSLVSGITGAQVLSHQTFGLRLQFGNPGAANVALLNKGQFRILFSRKVLSIGDVSGGLKAFTQGTSAATLATQLQTALYTDPTASGLLGTITTSLAAPPISLNLTAAFGGSESRRIFYNLTRNVTQYTATTTASAIATATTITVNAIPTISASLVSSYTVTIGANTYNVASWNQGTGVITLATGLIVPVIFGAEVIISSQAAAQDLLFNGSVANYNVWNNLAEGYDGSTYASQNFYDITGQPIIKVMALTPGAYGNNLSVTVTPQGIVNGAASFLLQVQDLNTGVLAGPSSTETWLISNLKIDGATGLYLDTQDSNFIRAYFLPVAEPANTFAGIDPLIYQSQPVRLAPPLQLYSPVFASGLTALSAQGQLVTTNVRLSGGADYFPTNLDAQIAKLNGYYAATKKMADQSFAMWALPGLTFGDTYYKQVFDEAIEQTLSVGPELGYRILVLDAPAKMPGQQALVLSTQLNSERIVLLRGNQVMTTSQNYSFPNVFSSGTYCGYVSVRSPHVSPASPYGGVLPAGIQAVDTDNSIAYKNAITLGHCEALVYDAGLKNFKFLNGLTTSDDPTLRYVSTRRILDQVVRDLYQSLQWVLSEPNNPKLQAKVASACDAYLNQKLRDEWLLRVAPTVCGPQNNSFTDQLNGILNIQLRLTPVFPADFIRVGIIRDLSLDFSLTTAPSSTSPF